MANKPTPLNDAQQAACKAALERKTADRNQLQEQLKGHNDAIKKLRPDNAEKNRDIAQLKKGI